MGLFLSRWELLRWERCIVDALPNLLHSFWTGCRGWTWSLVLLGSVGPLFAQELAPDPGDSPVWSYPYGTHLVKLVPDRERVAVLLERAATERPFESGLARLGLALADDPAFLPPRREDEQRYQDLWLPRLAPELTALERDEAIARVHGRPGVAFAAVLLRYREALVIPKPELIVVLEEGHPGLRDSLSSREDLSLIREFPALAPTFQFALNDELGNAFAAAALLRDLPGVAVAQPNFILHLPPHIAPNDPLFPSQASLANQGQTGGVRGADIHALEGWNYAVGAEEMVIAIIDEGVDVDHEDLAPHIVGGRDSTNLPPPEGIPGNADPNDRHGTPCAGIAAAVGNNGLGVTGVCWHARIMPIRVGYGTIWTEDAWVVDAITWAADHGAHVLSNSWGGAPPSTPVEAAIAYAKTTGRGGLGSPVFFSSGNLNSSVSFPGSAPEAIAVGATSPCDERKSPDSCDGEFWWGSNFGPELDIVAPGPKSVTTDMMGDAGYSPGNYTFTFSGTSAACPHVAGAAALLLTLRPELTADEVQSFLESAADDEVGLASEDFPGWDQYMGHGRLNLERLLEMAGGLQAPGDLTCTGEGSTASLNWTNHDNYTGIVIFRDGLEVTRVPGDATSHQDHAASGSHRYSIRGEGPGPSSPQISCTVFLPGTASDLVWSPPDAGGPTDSGLAELIALLDNGREGALVTDLQLVSDLNAFDAVWVNLGMFPHNHTLTNAESQRLIEFLADGRGGSHLYLEGGDTWVFDPPTALHAYFNIDGVDDGFDDLGTQVGTGAGICDLSGMTLAYDGENSSIDRLQAEAGSMVVLENADPDYNVVVFNNQTVFRTIGASHEFGGLAARSASPSDLMAAYLQCLGSPGIPQPITDLSCGTDGSVVSLNWFNNGAYDQLDIARNGELLTTVHGNTEAVHDIGVAGGTWLYTVTARAGSVTAIPSSCAVAVETPLNLLVAGNAMAIPGGTGIQIVRASTEQETQELAFGVTFDPTILQVSNITSDGTLLGQLSPEVFSTAWDNTEGFYTVTVAMRPAQAMPPGIDFSLVRVEFQVDPTVPLGAQSRLDVAANVGGVDTVFIQSGTTFSPVRLPGMFHAEEPVEMTLTAPGVEAPAGAQGVSHFVLASNELDLRGFSYGLDFNPGVLAVELVDLANTVPGAIGVDFFAPFINNFAGYYTVGAVVDVSPPLDAVLPAGTHQPIIRALFDVKAGARIGTSPLMLPLAVGIPPVEATIAAANGLNYFPRLVPGIFTVNSEGLFIRGDSDVNGLHNLNDAISVLLYIFVQGSLPCRDAADANDDGVISLIDGFRILGYLFQSGPPLPPPFPAAGADLTSDAIDCAQGL